MNLRPYQVETVKAVEAGWRASIELDGHQVPVRKQLVVLPTGGGKTLCFSHLANRTKGKTLILCHREELISQAIEKLHAATGLIADKEKAEWRASRESKVVVASVQTLMRESRIERWPQDHFELVVADEAHHCLSSSWLTVLRYFDPYAKVLGVTATPDRSDRKNLGTYFQQLAHEVTLFDLIGQRYLAPITVKSVPLRLDISNVGSTAGDFKADDLGSALEPYLGQIARAISEHAGFRRTLAFLPLIDTSKKFVAACEAEGLRAVHVDGESRDRAEILEGYAAGKWDVLSNAMLLTEGYDVDSEPTGVGIDCIVVLRPTRSRPLFCQMVGRGTRIAPLKESLLLLDFLWMHAKHRICRPASLIAKSEEEADAITAMVEQAGLPSEVASQCELDLQDLAGKATAQREEALRKKLAEAAKKQGVTYSAEEFAMKHNALGVAEYEPTMPWESEPVTDRQKHVLKRARIDLATVKGKGHASKLIGLHYSVPTAATPGQKAAMKRAGYSHWATATAQEAQRFFQGLKRRKGVAA